MKVISIWQPYAQLAALGYKTIETRSWPAPQSVIGQRIGIASTKQVKPEQRQAFADPEFQRFYCQLGLPDFDALPLGYLLGTAILDSVDPMTDELIEDVSDEEKQYGWFRPGFFAWRLIKAQPLLQPIPIRGAQGIYDWHGELPDEQASRPQAASGDQGLQERPRDIRRDLRVI